MSDYKCLMEGKWLTANHVCAAQMLLKEAYPCQNGLIDTHLLMYKKLRPSYVEHFVQVIFSQPGHWVCVTNKFSASSNLIDIYMIQW